MLAYLDSLVLLQHVLLGDPKISAVFNHNEVVSSELLEIECMRVIHRYRLNGELDDNRFTEAKLRAERVLDGVSILRLTSSIKTRAKESFPVVVKTLDALHLATAIIFQKTRPNSPIHVYSYDQTFNRCARVLGFHAAFE